MWKMAHENLVTSNFGEKAKVAEAKMDGSHGCVLLTDGIYELGQHLIQVFVQEVRLFLILVQDERQTSCPFFSCCGILGVFYDRVQDLVHFLNLPKHVQGTTKAQIVRKVFHELATFFLELHFAMMERTLYLGF